MQVAVNEPDYWVFWDYRMDQLSRSGVMGRDATGAEEAGREILEKIAGDIAEQVAAARDEQSQSRNGARRSPRNARTALRSSCPRAVAQSRR